MTHLVCVLGTRPEAIKLAPVVLAARARPHQFRASIVSTGQHRDLALSALAPFALTPDADLHVMTADQQPTDVVSRILCKLPLVFASMKPDVVLVQGDTSTTLAAALSAFHLQIPVAHVEAGLRSDDLASPFPEEMNRRLTTTLSTLHFAPTRLARERLLAEGVAPERISVTGNTVVDAVMQLAARASLPSNLPLRDGAPVVLVTMHRRENHGEPLEQVCLAIRDLVALHPSTDVVWPVHPNPNVGACVRTFMRGVPNVHLLEPVSYLELLALLQASTVVLTDSGGLQEEAPAFGKPVLVLREETERPEGVRAGVARLVGTARATVAAETGRLLTNRRAYEAMTGGRNPYGDGRAAETILDVLAECAASGWHRLARRHPTPTITAAR